MINKKLLYLIIGVFFCFFVRSYLIKTHTLKNNFSELNNIEIYIETSDIEKVREISNKLSQFDNFLSYSYIDPSLELFLHNSLKVSSINQINTFLNIFEIPTFENLINTIEDLSSDYEYNYEIINSIVSELFNFCISDNPNINRNIIGSILSNSNLLDEKLGSYKIIAKSNKTFKTIRSKKIVYNQLFNYIESINKKNKIIKYVNFNNELAYDCFVKHSNRTKTEIEFEYSPQHVFYLNDLEELAHLEKDLYKNFHGKIVTQSINSYLTDNSLINDKYKKIKNIYLNISKYKKQKIEAKYDIKDIMKSLSVLDMNVSKYGDRDDFLILEQINFIYNYFKNNQNSNKLNNLVSRYNLQIPDIVQSIANTEPITVDFVNPFIYNEFFNTSNNKYVLKLKAFGINNFNLYTNFLLYNHSSLHLDIYLFIINISIFFVSLIFSVLIIKRYIFKK
jgi:hypothetical protein